MCLGGWSRHDGPGLPTDIARRLDPRLPGAASARPLRVVGAGPSTRAEQADVPRHPDHLDGVRLSDPRRRRQDVPPWASAHLTGAHRAGVDAGQPCGSRGPPRARGDVRHHRRPVGGDRRSHHPARSGRPAERRRRGLGGQERSDPGRRERGQERSDPGNRESGPELSVRPAGGVDVRAVGRHGVAGLAGQGADHSAAYRLRASRSRGRRMPRRGIPRRATDPRRAPALRDDGGDVEHAAAGAAGTARRADLRRWRTGLPEQRGLARRAGKVQEAP